MKGSTVALKPEMMMKEAPASVIADKTAAPVPAQKGTEDTAPAADAEMTVTEVPFTDPGEAGEAVKPPRRPRRRLPRLDPAVREILNVYHAWLGYLLIRMGEEELRVPAADITDALQNLSCRVGREGDVYVIRPARRDAAAEGAAPANTEARETDAPAEGGDRP